MQYDLSPFSAHRPKYMPGLRVGTQIMTKYVQKDVFGEHLNRDLLDSYSKQVSG